MAEGEEESLESLLNAATNPARRDEDWECIHRFTDRVNQELEGPQIAVRLLAHKIQSPQEREALFALTTTEACVKNCGQRFHQEIGKFRFLNEMIKVISPKYLGNLTTDKVKKKCVEIMYSWKSGLPHEGKIAEAYDMLKKQGIVKEDPVYIEETYNPPPPPPPKNAVFEDDEKSKLLARLLKSKHPEDLQAANRLIKNMVKQDEQRMEKVSRRVSELEAVNNNVKLLGEMLAHYNPSSSSAAEKDLMKELFDNLEKRRPNLFRLASDTDDKDNDGMAEILKANDDVSRVMGQFRRVVEGSTEEDESAPPPFNNNVGTTSLVDLDSPQKELRIDGGDSMLDSQLAALGLNDQTLSSGSDSQPGSDIAMLTQILGPNQQSTNFMASGNTGFTAFSQAAAPISIAPVAPPVQPVYSNIPAGQPGSLGLTPQPAQHLGHMSQPPAQNSFTSSVLTAPKPQQATSAFDSLDMLGKSLMEQSLPPDKKQAASVVQKPKVPMNQLSQQGQQMAPAMNQGQMAASGGMQPMQPAPAANHITSTAVPALQPQLPATASLVARGGMSTPTPPASLTASPAKTASPKPNIEVQPLTDVFVAIESVKPGSLPPLTAYDKKNMKIVLHFAQNRPREDTRVMVISVMSNNSSPVKSFMFQAAVPKSMKVKLQPSSATDLPPYNPILPPSAITQVMLLANPAKERIRLKFKVTYVMDDQNNSDVGEIDSFPNLFDES